jgi:ribosomal protein L32
MTTYAAVRFSEKNVLNEVTKWVTNPPAAGNIIRPDHVCKLCVYYKITQ